MNNKVFDLYHIDNFFLEVHPRYLYFYRDTNKLIEKLKKLVYSIFRLNFSKWNLHIEKDHLIHIVQWGIFEYQGRVRSTSVPKYREIWNKREKTDLVGQ